MSNFFKDGIRVEHLKQWLDWAGGLDNSVFVALPMIQRGSVWKPKQIIDLWDSLLRGMPLGSLMIGIIKKGGMVRPIGKTELVAIQDDGLGLIDGQQRTLAMLIAWPKVGEKMDKRVWVDFADQPSDEHLFRLHVTTQNHPFGFQKALPSTKLSLDDRRKARMAFIKEHDLGEKVPTTDELFANAKPWDRVLPIELGKLIDLCQQTKGDLWEDRVIKKIQALKQCKSDGYDDEQNPKFRTVLWEERLDINREKIKKRVNEFKLALDLLFKLQIPLIELREELFDPNETDARENVDPALAVLFKRIGTGGTALTDADYVYSICSGQVFSDTKIGCSSVFFLS
jgi:hypothetical protein